MLVVESLKKGINGEFINYQYFYRLIKTNFENQEFYGIEIERQDFSNDKLIKVEREKINYVEINKDIALNLLYTLCENEVSPLHLVDIIGEHSDRVIEEYSMNKFALCS